MFKQRLVVRVNADRQWLLMLVAFGVAVVGTRVFLEAAGYPQIGNSQLHFAHALWGGLLQFIALCIFLTYANRWAYSFSAAVGGVGVGLFIDEVGKFITQTNDYFFPFAAPIIYAALLLTALLYLWTRLQRPQSPRALLYYALEQLKNIVDHDLDLRERTEIAAALHQVIGVSNSAEQQKIARVLLELVSEATLIPAPKPGVFKRAVDALKSLEERFFSRATANILLLLAFAWNSIGGAVLLSALLMLFSNAQAQIVEPMFFSQSFEVSTDTAQWVLAHALLTLIIGVLYFVAAILLLIRRERSAIYLARIALALQLTLANMLGFYFNQFAMVSATLIEVTILIMVERYKARFLDRKILKTPSLDIVQS